MCLEDLKSGKETAICTVHWKCECRKGHICNYHSGRPETVVYRYSNKEDDWVFVDAFKQIFEEAKQWIALYEKQRKKALNHCGSCWAQLKTKKNGKGKTTYCPKGCRCLCSTTETCVVHFECTCLTTWLCNFHKAKRPDVAVALYNALPPNEPARRILLNSFVSEGIDHLKMKRLGRKPKELQLKFNPPVSVPSTKQVRIESVEVAKEPVALSSEEELRNGKHARESASQQIAEIKSKTFETKNAAKYDLACDLEAKLPEYRKWLEKQFLSSHSKRNYLSRISGFIAFVRNSKRDFGTLTSATKEEPVKYLCTFLRKEAKLKPATINSYLSAIDSFYDFLELGRSKIDRDELPEQALKILTLKEQKKFLKAIDDTTRVKDRAIASILFYTGMKLSECTNLDLSDIVISGRKTRAVIRDANGDKLRTIPLNSAVCHALEEWVLERTEKYAGRSVSSALFLNPQSNRMMPNALYEVVRKIGRSCNLQLSPHALRDTFISNLMRQDQNVFLVADIAGHKSLNTTKRYSNVGVVNKTKALEQLVTNRQ